MRPWDKRRSVGPFAVRPEQAQGFLGAWNPCLHESPPYDVVDVLLLLFIIIIIILFTPKVMFGMAYNNCRLKLTTSSLLNLCPVLTSIQNGIRTEWYGQNGIWIKCYTDKMVYGGQNGMRSTKWYMDRMVRTKWYMDKVLYRQNGIRRTKWYAEDKMVYGQNGTDKMVYG